MKRFTCAIFGALVLAACSPAFAPTPAGKPDAVATTTTAESADASGEPGSGPRAVDQAVAGQDFRITISEDANAGVFNLHLTSLNHERDLCVGAAEWPDSDGRLEGGGDYVSVSAHGQGYPMSDSHQNECGERCVRRIPPGASIDGFVGYDQFPRDAFDPPGPHTLNYGVEPYFCDSGEVQ